MTTESRNFFLITEGQAHAVDSTAAEVDGTESVLAYAADEAEALELAALFDAGQIQMDNVQFNGRAVAALSHQ